MSRFIEQRFREIAGSRKLPVLLIFAAVLLKFPLAPIYCFMPLVYHSSLEIMPDGAIAALALFLVLFPPGFDFRVARRMLIAGGVLAAVVILQAFKLSFFRVDYSLGALLAPALILFGWRYGRELKEMIFPALAVCWGLNLALTVRMWFSQAPCYGLTGNWNWSAVLLTASGIAVIYLIFHHIRERLPRIILGILAAVLSVWQFLMFFSTSRGGFLAVVAALGAFGVLHLCRRRPRLTGWILGAGMVVAALGFVVFLFPASGMLSEDTRFFLIPGGLKIAKENLFLGVSPELYESYALEAFNPGYFLSRYVSERNPHPHNQLVFIAACYGLPGLVAWIYLIFRPFTRLFRTLSEPHHCREKLLFFIFVLLLVSGLVDVTLESWPCKYLFLLIAGVFWHEIEPESDGVKMPARTAAALRIAAVPALCAALYLSCLYTWSSWLYRQANVMQDRGNGPEALRLLIRSSEINASPIALYRAGLIALFDARNPDLALQALSRVTPLTGRRNFIGIHGMLGRIYSLKGQSDTALKYFDRETRIYPYSVVNWRNYAQALEKAGKKEEAAAARRKYEETIRLKHLEPEHLPYLFKNQQYDLNTCKFLDDYKAGRIR